MPELPLQPPLPSTPTPNSLSFTLNQVHLREFYELNSRSHEVYEWARGVDLPEGTTPHLLFRNLSPDVQAEMTKLVKDDWMGLRRILPELLQATEQYQEAEPLLRQVSCCASAVHLHEFWRSCMI